MLSSPVQYDQCGNARNLWDAKGNLASIVYQDAFSDGVPRNTYTFPTQSTSPAVPDFVNPSATINLTTTSIYDFSTGLIVAGTDANGQTTTFNYNDPLNRLKQGSSRFQPLSTESPQLNSTEGWKSIRFFVVIVRTVSQPSPRL